MFIEWVRRIGFLGLAVLVFTACAQPELRHEADQHHLTQAELEALRAQVGEIEGLRTRIGKLESQIKALDARVVVGEQRVGLRPLRTDKLTVAGADIEPIKPGDALYVGGYREAGKKRKLGRILKDHGSYVMVFWATWCVPCTSDEELALLAQLQTQLRRRGVELVSVVIDDLAKVQVHPKAKRWIYPLWFAKDAHLAWLPQAFIRKVGVGLPIFLIVSRSGRLRYFSNKKLDPITVRDIVTAATN